MTVRPLHTTRKALAVAGAITALTLAAQGTGTVSAAVPRLHSGDAEATLTALAGAPTAVSSAPATPITVTGTPVATASPIPTSTPSKPAAYWPLQPRPTVHRTNGYQIGAYYFSGWSHGQNNNLTPLLANGPLRRYEPLIGWYDDSQSQVDKTIVQASNAGVDFFAFDWYDLAHAKYQTDKTLNEALGYYLSSHQRHRLNFALTYIDQAPFLTKAREWPRLVKSWIPYFKQPDYVRVNGKPLFIIFSPEHMRDMFGSSKNVHKALTYLRAQVKAAHLPGITIAVGATLTPTFNKARIGQLNSEGYDVLTGYNYHAMGHEKYRTPVPYDRLVQENEQMWARIAKNFHQPYIPVVTSGWDQRFSAREQKTAIIYAGRISTKFACYAGAARQWVDQNRHHTVKEKMVMIFAWNEIGEGGMIIPTKADKSAYADSLHKAFTSKHPQVCS